MHGVSSECIVCVWRVYFVRIVCKVCIDLVSLCVSRQRVQQYLPPQEVQV